MKQGLGGNVRIILSGAAPLANHVEEFLRVVSCAHVLQGYGNLTKIHIHMAINQIATYNIHTKSAMSTAMTGMTSFAAVNYHCSRSLSPSFSLGFSLRFSPSLSFSFLLFTFVYV